MDHADHAAPTSTPTANRTVRVGDLDVAYDLTDYTEPWRTTPPETVLLFHGYARNMQFWRPWVPLLSGHYRVLRFDARGCGGTTRTAPGERYAIEQFVEDAIGVLDALDIERVHWVGESSGGIVGLTAALNHRARLQTLTLCDTPFKRPVEITQIYTLGESDRATAFAKHGVAGWCRQTLSYRLDLSHASPALQDWYCAQMGQTPADIAAALELMIRRGDLWPRLPEVRVPTLILAGENSPIAKASMMADMQDRLPGAVWKRFAGYGHGVNLLAPALCVAEFKAFVAAQSNA